MSVGKIIVIDGSSYFFRAYYAIPNLSNSKGFPTNAILGFLNMLIRVLEGEKPERIVIAFDTPKPSFRKKKYAEYKANREAPPEDLIVQIPHILRAVDCFGVKRFELEGFEADDVIGTLAKRAVASGYEVEVITGDKDLMQLVSDRVVLYDSMKDKRYDVKGVEERFGVKPEQIIDLLGLMGDASDNIPGVTGIGEKTAASLLQQFGSMDGIFARLEEIKQEKRRETLRAEREIAYLSRELATVHCEVPINFSWDDLRYQGPNRSALQAFLQEMELHSLLKRYQFEPAVPAGTTPFKQANYLTVDSEEKLQEMVVELSGVSRLAVDTETTSLNPRSASLVGLSLSAGTGNAYYVPVGHHAPGDVGNRLVGQLPHDTVKKALRPILQNAAIGKVGQNLKYDLQILRGFGLELTGIVADTLLESYLVDPESPHNLDALAQRYLGHQNISYEEVTGKGRNQISFAEVSIAKATDYAAEDADVTWQLHGALTPQLKKASLAELYERVELPLVQILADMEWEGVLVDAPALHRMSDGLEAEMGQVEIGIYELAGESFNVSSPKQLSKILFEKLGLPVIRKTKTGVSTDESVLSELRDKHKICDQILRYRELQKIRSTYVEGLIAQLNPHTGRVHTHYNQTGTATGRLSSSNPNLQNIPVTKDEAYDIRSVFIADQGKRFLSADYSQVELRLLASMSGDEELLRAFRNNEDVHEYTGRLIFNKSQISPEERRVAKTINFGVVYGQTPYGLSQMLKITPGQAKEFIDRYFERYAGIRGFLQSLVVECRDRGYVSTLLGRRRYLPDIKSQNRMKREMAERAAINAPLQGTAADMIKLAMVTLSRRLATEKKSAKMIMQVHDELVLEVPEGELASVEKIVREEMEKALELKIPLRVEVGSGVNWRDCD